MILQKSAFFFVASQNVALYKSAEISSEINPTWTADKGVDGATSQNMFDDTCFHTNNETEPYFIVNLGSVYDISNIYIYNRQDCCGTSSKQKKIAFSGPAYLSFK